MSRHLPLFFREDWTLEEIRTRLRQLDPKKADALDTIERDCINHAPNGELTDDPRTGLRMLALDVLRHSWPGQKDTTTK